MDFESCYNNFGLVRHFQPISTYNCNRFMTGIEFKEWVREYNTADINHGDLRLDRSEWQKCYASDLPRAIQTARMIYNGEIIETQILREIPIEPVFRTSLKIHFALWSILGRVAWLASHKSQTENRIQTQKRVDGFISQILSLEESNILIVSHGGIVWLLQKELIKHGFVGKRFTKAKNGKLYVFEK